MFYLMMTYCLAGQPCVQEVVAQFPQWDVGMAVCEMAKPGIEAGVRRKAGKSTKITFECEQEYEPPIPRAQLNAPKNTTLYNQDETQDLMKQGLRILESIKR